MAQAPSPATKDSDLPTIIIDPLAYVPERPSQRARVYDNFLRLTRVTIAVGAVGAATFGVAQLLPSDSLLQSEPVSALTSTFSDHANERVKSPSSPVAEAIAAAAPVAQPAQAEAPSAEMLPAEAPQAPEPALAEAPIALENPTPARAAPAPVARVPQAKLVSAPSQAEEGALPKPVKKEMNVDDEVRNARRLLALNRLEQAEAAYRRVLLVNASEPAAVTGLARVQLARGELDDALASAKRAVATAPGLASAQLTLGDVLRARGDKVAAQAHYDQAAQLMPNPEPSEP